MITIEGTSGAELAKVPSGGIAKPSKPMTVGELELALLKRFPREDAEPWDRTGLLVGDPAAVVTGVVVALDATDEAIRKAADLGANVVLTHHPAFLDPPVVISPSLSVASPAGANVYKAVLSGIALMNFHTALDASPEATRLIAGMLSLDFRGLLQPLAHDGEKGYGQVCTVRDSDIPFKLSHLAARCTAVFGRVPRVWGDYSAVVRKVVIANGSAGSVVESCVSSGVDCLVCGEVRYHAALDASAAGLAIIELGHDVSEFPLTALLAQAASDAGVSPDNVAVIDQSRKWSYPDATRI